MWTGIINLRQGDPRESNIKDSTAVEQASIKILSVAKVQLRKRNKACQYVGSESREW